ncbi:MAG TPA: hypothetical protein VK559_12690 [Ferruginibacter sp.]|nr:hypothetical protein [Ferruginibacter sp.]
MKNIFLVVVLAFAFNAAGFAQCDKKVVLTSSTTEYLDSNNVVERSVPENTTIKIDKSASLTIAPGKDHEMNGTITQNICNWKVPYKEGKSIIKATLTDKSGDVKTATITIEGKEKKITFLLEVAEMPGKKIRISVNTFQEEN